MSRSQNVYAHAAMRMFTDRYGRRVAGSVEGPAATTNAPGRTRSSSARPAVGLAIPYLTKPYLPAQCWPRGAGAALTPALPKRNAANGAGTHSREAA
jgi:hypothetical protein